MHVWWPGITKDIECDCLECQQHKLAPPLAPLYQWSWPMRLIAYGLRPPVDSKIILVIIDTHSWVEAIDTIPYGTGLEAYHVSSYIYL